MRKPRDKFVWRITQALGEEPRIEVGSVLDDLQPKDYLPAIASSLVDMGTFLFKVCIENNDISVEDSVSEPEENDEDYDFE